MSLTVRLAAVSVLCASLAVPAWAQEWHGQATIYGWFPVIEGEQEREDGEPRVQIDAKQVLEALDMAFMAAGEIRRDKLGFLFDVNYARLSSSGETGDRIPVAANMKTTVSFATAAAAWRFYERERRFFEAYGGIRAYNTEASFQLQVGRFSPDFSASARWVDPIVGLRAFVPISERWSVTGFGDVGGTGGGDYSWELYGGLNYAFSDRWAGVLGYRYMSITHDANELSLDVNLQGPLFGVTYMF
jgi:opacity protein-like surface antigen